MFLCAILSCSLWSLALRAGRIRRSIAFPVMGRKPAGIPGVMPSRGCKALPRGSLAVRGRGLPGSIGRLRERRVVSSDEMEDLREGQVTGEQGPVSRSRIPPETEPVDRAVEGRGGGGQGFGSCAGCGCAMRGLLVSGAKGMRGWLVSGAKGEPA